MRLIIFLVDELWCFDMRISTSKWFDQGVYEVDVVVHSAELEGWR